MNTPITITENPNELTIENSVLLLIDHQPAVAVNVHSIDHGLLTNNVAALSAVAKGFGVPTVLTTVGAQGSVLVDPIFKEISEAFPEVTPIDRPSSHAWSHPEVRRQVEATGRRKLVMAGLVTEVCLAQSVLAARKDGYDVYFVSDCSGGVTKEAHDDAKVRMTMAGAQPLNWMALTGEWAPYWASPERALISTIASQRGDSTSALVNDWIMAQITAGVVSLPDSLAESVRAGA
ncbi:MAG TPA: isochorismatase family protein [Acidimicrobiales bacterium]|nr:isochorismatase family protein [Acidimicrobiales bacterium]